MKILERTQLNKEMKSMLVCKLIKALYSLRLSPKRWYERFKETILKLGFTEYPFQACIFIWRKNNHVVFLLLYVDNILMAENCVEKIN